MNIRIKLRFCRDIRIFSLTVNQKNFKLDFLSSSIYTLGMFPHILTVYNTVQRVHTFSFQTSKFACFDPFSNH